MPDEPQMPQTPAGWYPDPEGGPGQRYWDGMQWTEHRHQAAPPGIPAGPPPGAAFAQPPPAAPKTNGWAIASLVLGIIGGSVLAIVFGLVGRSQIKKSNGAQTGKGLATAGIALGSVWLVVIIAFVVLGATGVLDDTNADKYKDGQQHEIAVLVDRVETGFDDNKGDEVCNELFTREWADQIAAGSRTSCEQFISKTDKNKVQAELKIQDLTVTGDRATAQVKEGGDSQTWRFERENGAWKVSNISV